MYSEYSRLFWDNWCRKSSNNFLRQIVGVGCSVLSLYSFNEIHVWLLLLKINFLSENNSGEIFAHWKRKCLLTGPPSHHIKKTNNGKKRFGKCYNCNSLLFDRNSSNCGKCTLKHGSCLFEERILNVGISKCNCQVSYNVYLLSYFSWSWTRTPSFLILGMLTLFR